LIIDLDGLRFESGVPAAAPLNTGKVQHLRFCQYYIHAVSVRLLFDYGKS
jgi:hypothetical protein